MRIRQLEAGELQGDDRARVEAHLAACARCQETAGEIAAEHGEVARALPFDAFAAGVAERLAARAAAPRPRWRGAIPLALAASLVAAGMAPVLLRLRGDRTDAIQIKGAAALSIYVREGAEPRALAPGEPVPEGAPLRLALEPAGRRFAAVALLDGDGAALLYAGPAQAGLLPGAFEWTGSGPGTLVLVLDDAPVDGPALSRRLEAGGTAAASPHGGAEVLSLPLSRGSR
jgi:hypothetical protein